MSSPEKQPTHEQLDLLARLIVVNSKLESAKELYQQQDDLVLALKKTGFESVTLDDKRYTLKDNFESANTAFKVSFMKRYEVKVTKVKAEGQ